MAVLGASALVAGAMAGTAGVTTAAQGATNAADGQAQSYIVLVDQGASVSGVAADLKAAGNKVTSVNKAVGMVSVTTADQAFRAHAAKVDGVEGVAANRVIGRAPTRVVDQVERENLAAARKATKQAAKKQAAKKHGKKHGHAKADPLDGNLWGMRMINADKAHRRTLGDKRVKVGVMDTGVQADHPDIHGNFDYRASRNFTTDIPAIDGPCESANCVDPVGEDDNGHGTHVAGTMAAALNGFGVSGVAPRSTIVEVRAGQDAGFFFTGPTVNALTYSGDAGLDVVNMSFYVDPWWMNCAGGAPEDTPAQAADQDITLKAMTRALDYAHAKGVTLVAAAGNDHTDLAKTVADETSPDYGADPHHRTVNDATCKIMPVEGPHVLGIGSVGPSGTKADYSNWTTNLRSGEIELAAPGGWFRDGFGTPSYRTNSNMILSSVPLVALQDTGEVDADGNITPDGEATGVIKECQKRPTRGTTACGYYAWFQGTSMASPHAAGVAALAVAAHGRQHGRHGFGMSPDAVRSLMMRTATNHACPAGGVQSYTNEGRDASFTATCVGTPRFNGFSGDGIVNALGVVGHRR